MEEPFIHLLKTVRGYYCFDVNKNEVIGLDKDVYTYLASLSRPKRLEDINQEKVSEEMEASKETLEKVAFLKSKGYLSSKHVSRIEHCYTKDLPYYLGRRVSKMTLQVTQNCNFRCTYCVYSQENEGVQRSHSNKVMSLEMAKEAVDFLVEHSMDCQEVNLAFYGGEPLLAFDLIREIIVYAEDSFVGKDLSFSMTTNATLLDEEKLELLMAHHVMLMISLDGPKEIHDQNRHFANGQGTFDKVIEKLLMIHDKYPEYLRSISISMVIDPRNDYDSINSVCETYPFLKEMNINASLIDDMYNCKKNFFSEAYNEESNYHMFLAFLGEINSEFKVNVSTLATKSIQYILDQQDDMRGTLQLEDIAAPGGPCIPGERRLLVNVTGDFYPCERVSENSEAMKIGNLKEGFNLKKISDLLNIGKLTESQCKQCWAFNHCSLCAKYADNHGKLSGKLKSTYCNSVCRDLEYDLLVMILLKEGKYMYTK